MPVIKDTSKYRDDEDIFETYEKTKFEHRIALGRDRNHLVHIIHQKAFKLYRLSKFGLSWTNQNV